MKTALVRPARADDLHDVEQLLRDSELPTIGVADILRTHPDRFVVAASPDAAGEIVGVAGLEVCCDDALLRSVAVRPEWRSRGVGRTLIEYILHEAEARGIRALYLLTQTADRYFPRFGFEQIERGSVPQAIADTEEFRSACPASAIAMSRPLSPVTA